MVLMCCLRTSSVASIVITNCFTRLRYGPTRHFSRYSSAFANVSSTRNVFRPIPNNVDPKSQDFKQNQTQSLMFENQLNEAVKLAHSGGGPKGIERHVEKNKKWLATKRLESVLDSDEEFLELSTLAGLGMEYGNIPRGGLITGIGKIHGIHCMLVVNDATVKGGTIYPIALKKQLRAQEIAMQNHLPMIYIVDSGGAFLPLQADIFLEGGRTFRNEAVASSLAIPQLAIVVGNCTAGGAYVPTMAQEAVIVHRIGTVFLGGPPLVYAALGEQVSAENLGGATLHCKVSGCTDHFAATEEEAYETGRDIVATFNVAEPVEPSDYDEPVLDPAELPGLIPVSEQYKMDPHQVIGRIVDGSRFQEFKALFGPTLVTGFAKIQGYLVGVIANNGEITMAAALKGSHFVQLCVERGIPLVFFQNSTPENSSITTQEEALSDGNRLRSHAAMMSAVACANVPKLTVIMGDSTGSANYLMCGRSFSPDFLFTWPNARISMVEQTVLKQHIIKTKFPNEVDEESEEYKAFNSKVVDRVMQTTKAMYASSRVWDDGIILPQNTRNVLGHCLKITHQSQRKMDSQPAMIRM